MANLRWLALTLALGALVRVAHAWLPGTGPEKRSIVDVDGFSLFNDTMTTVAGRGMARGNGAARRERRWLGASAKVRGVNLGSLFIVEPWMMSRTWEQMGCGGTPSEFDCMLRLGQTAGDAAFQRHWSSWIAEQDFEDMRANGINTVRIPLGYWMLETLVYRDSEHFPRGAVDHLKRVCGWASDRGIYIILELHGAPGAQVARNSFTGQNAETPGFYQTHQYDRAIQFLVWLRRLIHDNRELRNTGMIGLLNEPVQGPSAPESLRSYFYANAFKAIRDAESALGVAPTDFVHLQMMNSLWGSGDPTQFLPSRYFTAFDDHRYLKWAGVPDVSHDGFLRATCADNRAADGLSPTIVGEWSTSVPDHLQWTDGWHPDAHKDFYRRWFSAQILKYEQYTLGWVAWSWKTELGDYRWSYKDALAAGVAPRDLNSISSSGACNGF